MGIPGISPEQKVFRYINEQRLVLPGKKLLVAVSGGPDSVCLLHILWKLHKALGIQLHIAHLNHLLRSAESDDDAAYVKELAVKLKIPATIESSDVKAYRSLHRLSLEEAAREVRYNFLAETATTIASERVAVGHTANDHVETILMHLIRGSGARGMRGLLPVNRWRRGGKKLTVIRPLLEFTREETTSYCRRHRLHPRLDSSNLTVEPFRNRIRHELIPMLKTYNPQMAEALQRTARLAADDLEFIAKEAARRECDLVQYEGSAVKIDKKKFLALPAALKRHILRRAIESLLGDLKDIEAKHIEDALNALEKPSGRVIGLPGGLKLTIEYDRYLLAPETVSSCPFPALEDEYDLLIPGRTRIPGGEFRASIEPIRKNTGHYVEANVFTAFLDFSKTGKALVVRCRQEGDRFQPLGLSRPKKLNTFMIDARIPRAWRGRIPIVTAGGQIVWVTGWRIDERVKVTDGTSQVLRLEFKRS